MRQFVKRECPVIPVLLPDYDQEPTLPIFLESRMGVDFRKPEPDPMEQLTWGITGERNFLGIIGEHNFWKIIGERNWPR